MRHGCTATLNFDGGRARPPLVGHGIIPTMIYRFGDWQLHPALRELRRDGLAVAAPRRVFDLLVYLVEQRDRAVGRDELVSAVWGHLAVADVQVSQLIARTRRLLGDDAQSPMAIRTVPGFGYRWVMPVAVDAAPNPDIVPPMADVEPPLEPAIAPVAGATHAVVQRRRLLGALAVALVSTIVFAALLVARLGDHRVESRTAAPASVAVLPVEVDGPADASWVSLGIMDLVAARLRDAGLAVPPSDSVMVALHAARTRDGVRSSGVGAILGIAQVVHGTARRTANGWLVALETDAGDGQRHHVEAERVDVIDAGRRAADLLIAALGRRDTSPREAGEAVDEIAQRVQAATLAGSYDAAAEIIAAAPPDMRTHPRLRLQAAQLDYYRGRVDAATAAVDALLAGELDGPLRARALTSRGLLYIRGGDCASAERAFDAALAAWPNTEATALAGRGLARTCLDRHAAAADDLGLARVRLEAAGDRLGVARADNYLGILDANRNRLDAARTRFEAAYETFEAFGVIDAQRAALSALIDTDAHLLRWNDALRDAEHLAALRPKITDAAQRQILDSDRARVFIGVGRWREAAQLLAPTADEVTSGAAQRYLDAVRAELAWSEGRRDDARAAAERALANWPDRASDDRRAAAVLVLARTSPTFVVPSPPDSGSDVASSALPLLRIAAAERAATSGDGAAAGRAFGEAQAAADAAGVPSVLVATTASHAQWLIAGGRIEEAASLAGRIAPWTQEDFDGAVLRIALFRARGDVDAWRTAVDAAHRLAGERQIPVALLEAPRKTAGEKHESITK